MNRKQFEQQRKAEWVKLDKLLSVLERKGTRKERRRKQSREALAELPTLYRQVCNDLSLARHRDYGAVLTDRLNQLALRGYHQLYRSRLGFWRRAGRFVAVDFPVEVRANARLFWFCMALFWVPFLSMIAAGQWAPEWVYATLSAENVATLDANFGEASELGDGRESSSDLQMFAFYIYNNVGIDFRTFAGGVLAGIGTIFFLVFNGVYLGASFGHVQHSGGTMLENFWAFTAGHGSFELMAIIISGMAGMKIGLAILAPGRLTRARALKERGREGVRLLYGAALMTTTAAFIEAFWSPSSVPHNVKYVFGGCMWLIVLAYLGLCGRNRADR